jgi:hypothetical protein
MKRLTDGERDILREQERDAEGVPGEAEMDEIAAGYDWPAELELDHDDPDDADVPVVVYSPAAVADPNNPW